MEVNLDEDSQLNNSTVRISFEDFVRSQSQDEAEEDIKDEQGKEDQSNKTAKAEEMDSDQLDIPKAQENTDSGEPSVQVSPRTVTIQAEVHAVSPKQEAAKAVGKLASIFSRRKGVSSPAEVVSSPPPEHGPKLPSLTVKRKSNVVLQEEDLELAVLESESTPKCSEAERKQFMAAFKQPSLDGSKTKPVKSQGKQKQPEENVLDAADKVAEDDVVPLCVEQGNQGKNAAKKKPARRGRNKAEEEKEATSISAVAAVEEHVTTTVEVEDKTEEAPVASAPSVPAVRRSRRQATVQPAPETVTTPPTSTPETRKSKRGVFVAEMVCPPDANQSPIRESKKRKQAKKLVEKAKDNNYHITWSVLFQQSPGQEAVDWKLLTDSRRRGVDLLYSNMEKLLPLPLTQLTTSTFKPEQCFPVSQDPSFSCLQPDTMPSNTKSLHSTGGADSSEDGSPVKVSSRMRKNKTRHHLPDQDALHSDSEDEFLSLCRLQDAPQAKEEIKGASVLERISKKPLTPEERVKGVPVSQCLQSIADFFDNMSYMDSSLLFHPHGGDIHRRPACAVVKDGMTDELGVETDGGSWMTGDHVLEIQAAVEALSFHKCRASVAESWDGARHIGGELGREAAAELSLPVAAQQDGYSFTQHSPCQPQLVQRRRDVMESLMAKGTFGNKPAAALDYLPIIRTICRSEQLKERGKVKRRFLHYLDAIHLGLEKSTLQFLAEAFP
uniref:ATPase family AAA domain-containing protein 5-like n=1 Tax=Stegastes partitus TaxID=144197 RepID=A0A3B4ZPJ7_9TELE